MIEEDTQELRDAVGLETTGVILPSTEIEEDTDSVKTTDQTEPIYRDVPLPNYDDADFAQVGSFVAHPSSSPSSFDQTEQHTPVKMESEPIDHQEEQKFQNQNEWDPDTLEAHLSLADSTSLVTPSQERALFSVDLNQIDQDHPVDADDLDPTQRIHPETTKAATLRSLAGKLMELAKSGKDSPLSMLMASGEHTAFLDEDKGQAEFAMAMLDSENTPIFFDVLLDWKNKKGCYIGSYQDQWMNFSLEIESDDPDDLFAQLKEHLL